MQNKTKSSEKKRLINNNNFSFVLISDTHANINPKIFNLISSTDYVIHAGDIMDYQIIESIKLICRDIYAVNGNNDTYKELRDIEEISTPIGDIIVTHGDKHYPDYHHSLREMFPTALMVIYGHSHEHIIDTTKKPYIINPGAAGTTRTNGGASCVLIKNNNDGLSIDLRKFYN